jgi:hypothetical protein
MFVGGYKCEVGADIALTSRSRVYDHARVILTCRALQVRRPQARRPIGKTPVPRAGKTTESLIRREARARRSYSDLLESFADAAELAAARADNDATRPQEKGSNLLKVAIYREVWRLFREGRQRRLQLMSEGYDLGDKTIDFDRNPFSWILPVLKKEGHLNKFVGSSIANLSWQLTHALRHDIAPDLLIGFLYQTSASSPDKQKLIKRRGLIFYEEWIRDYRLSLDKPQI